MPAEGGGGGGAVSRETLPGAVRAAAPEPPDPAAWPAAWRAALPGLTAYAALLADAGVVRGLIGPREVPRLWDRHLLNSLAVEPLVPAGARVADVGSGAGLPGLAVALVRPDLSVDLVEPLLRRTVFLAEAVEVLGLGGRVRVVRARAEEAERGAYDVVLARAVAPLGTLAGWCLPMLRPGGALLALKGEQAAVELDRDGAAVRAAGGVDGTLESVGLPGAPTQVVRVIRSGTMGPGPARADRGPRRPDQRDQREQRAKQGGRAGR
jgi:16S rRNA (guanine527-N7)-methyltransferase